MIYLKFAARKEQTATDWKSLMFLGMLSRPCALAAYPFIFGTKASGLRLGLMQRLKEFNFERMGCVEAMESVSSLVFVFLLFASARTAERGRTWKRTDMCRTCWKDGWKTSLLSLPLAGCKLSVIVSKVNRRELSHSRLWVGNRSLLRCLAHAVSFGFCRSQFAVS